MNFNPEKKINNLIYSIIIPIICMLLTIIIISIININSNYFGLFLTIGQLVGTIILINLFKLTAHDLGLSYIKENMRIHLIGILLLVLITIIVNFALIGITGLAKVNFDMFYYFIFYIIVSITEELYFRGVLYHQLELWNQNTALFGSSIIFALFHIRGGLQNVFVNFFTGISFGIIRFASGMILLIIPYHFIFNFQSALFISNESSDPIIIITYIGLVTIFSSILFIMGKSKEKQS